MNELYPLKFEPIVKDKIWGGKRLKNVLSKKKASEKAGESWEISGVHGNVSRVANGFLKGNDLLELIEVYMGDLVGDKVFDHFGNTFPLLIKFIDANDILSLQVHPDDELAFKRHESFGKTEMWYVIQAEENAEIINGFSRETNKQSFMEYIRTNDLNKILRKVKARSGDAFFIPSGRVHAISAGVLIAEIQQSSDITYRIYDWNRVDENGNPRELHTPIALDAIDFGVTKEEKIEYKREINTSTRLVECEYFTTNLMCFDEIVEKDFNLIDSFVIYLCVEGNIEILYGNNLKTTITKGETILIPAFLKEIVLVPMGKSEVLEVYIK